MECKRVWFFFYVVGSEYTLFGKDVWVKVGYDVGESVFTYSWWVMWRYLRI